MIGNHNSRPREAELEKLRNDNLAQQAALESEREMLVDELDRLVHATPASEDSISASESALEKEQAELQRAT